MLLSMGDQIRDGTYRVHSRFRRVVNFGNGHAMVSLVDRCVDPGPCRIVVPLENFRRAQVLRIEQHGLSIDRSAFDTARTPRYNSRIDQPAGLHATLPVCLAIIREELCQRPPDRSLVFLLDHKRLAGLRPGFETALAAHLKKGADGVLYALGTGIARDTHGRRGRRPSHTFLHLREGHRPRCPGRRGPAVARRAMADKRRPSQPNLSLQAAISHLAGCGFGLTPSGDDFIAGMLIALHVLEHLVPVDRSALRRQIFEAAHSGNAISMHFLSLAYEGRVTAGMKYLLASMGDRSENLRAWTRHTLDMGDTSGADLLTGFLLTLQHTLPPHIMEGVRL